MSFVESIARKRDGETLSPAEIGRFVAGAVDGSLPSEQLAAMLMAMCCRGLERREVQQLTEHMLRSGDTWRLADELPGVVDKHSTGGVGDTVSLVLAALLAAVGVPVAMMAGRGLGHSQGTLDKLEAVPGFGVHSDRQRVLEVLDSCGAAIFAQSDRVAPADRVLYALRDVTATVPSLGLIVASIMSKKLAVGASALVLDVKWGSGAFRPTVAAAHELGLALRAVARDAGTPCEALLTDMNQPLGPALGTACEVRAALEVLDGAGDARLRDVTLRLAEEAMVLVGHDAGSARQRLRAALADGSAMAAWRRIVEAHGGDPDPRRLPSPTTSVPVTAAGAGVVTGIEAAELGWVAVAVGAGRRHRDEKLAHGAGVEVRVRLGDRVERGQPLATLLIGDRPVELEALCDRVRAAFSLGEEAVQTSPLVVGTVDEVEPHDVAR